MRINVLGAAGCGASTTGRAVASALGIPYFDSDDYYHGPSEPPYQNPRPPDQRRAMLEADLAGDAWVLAGGAGLWEPSPRLSFTLVAFLWVPCEIRIRRLRQRERERFGGRLDPGGDMHEAHEAFIAWAAGYDDGDVEGKTLARHEAFLATSEVPVLELRGAQSLASLTRRILDAVERR